MRPTWDQLRIAEQLEREERDREQALKDQIRCEKARLARRAQWSELQRSYWHATHCRRIVMGHIGPVTDEIRHYFVDRYRERFGFDPRECGCEERP